MGLACAPSRADSIRTMSSHRRYRCRSERTMASISYPKSQPPRRRSSNCCRFRAKSSIEGRIHNDFRPAARTARQIIPGLEDSPVFDRKDVDAATGATSEPASCWARSASVRTS
jgi:hypothetical protein